MKRHAHPALALLTVLAFLGQARDGRAAPASTDGLDPKTDPRLARHLLLRSEGVPVSHVLRRLGEKSGVVLTASGQPGDERLIAFAPDTSLVEIMRSIADLYRLRWVRGGTAERPTYQLLKSVAAAREETALKQRVIQESLAEMDRQLKQPPPDPRGDPQGHIAALRGTAAAVIRANWERLLAESHLEIPIDELPATQKEVVATHGPAMLQSLAQDLYENDLAVREQLLKSGKELPDYLKAEPQVRQVPPIETCTLTLDLKTNEGLQFTCMLSTPSFATSLVMGKASQTEAAGVTLYADRKPRPTPPPAGTPRGAAPLDSPLPDNDPLARPLVVENNSLPENSQRNSWLTALENLSDLGKLAVYSDDYSNPDTGGTRREAEPPRNGISAGAYLDQICRQPNWETAGSFWWGRGGAVLIRSRSFLQEADSVIPASLADHLLARGHSAEGNLVLTAGDLPELGRLTNAQLRGLAHWGEPIQAWKNAIQVPSRLSPAARALVVTGGITWETMPEPDRALAAQLSGGQIGPGYRAHVTAGATHPSWRSSSGIHLRLETERTPGSAYSLMLPAPQLNPQGLLVMDPARTRGNAVKPERLVFALYYPWYGLQAVSGENRKVQQVDGKIKNFAHYPAAGPYDSTDEAVVRRQLHQMREAGIDVVACAWPGPKSFEDRAMRKLLPLARAEGLRVCLSLDGVRVESALELRTKLTAWIRDVCADPAYLRVDGKPVLFLGYQLQEKLSHQEWADLFEALDRSSSPGIFTVIPGFTPQDSMLFSGTDLNAHNSWEPNSPPLAIARNAREMMVRGMTSVRRYGRVAVARVSPGFDARHMYKDADQLIDRAGGAYYRALWDAAQEVGVDWVLVDSFNQWETGSEIEPSREYGDTYLKLTAEGAARFKAAKSADK